MKFSCKDISELISRSMDERLPFGQRLAIKLHVLICKGCRGFSRQMRQLREAMNQVTRSLPSEARPAREALSPESRTRLEQVIRSAARSKSADKS